MKVTVVSRIYRPEPSAASSFLGAVVDELGQRGHAVTVLTVRAPGAGKLVSPERIRRWPVLRDSSGYVRGYLQYLSFDAPLALRLLFTERPDVVLVEPPPTTGAVVRVICRLRRIPYLYDVADIWSDAVGTATSSRAVARVLRAVERFALAGASRLVTISAPVRERVAQLGVRTPVAVTGFGADTGAFTFDRGATPEPTFVYGGTYSEIHGASVLVRGFAEFLTVQPGYRLRFIGNGTERERLSALAAELGIGASVEFVEPQSPEELAVELNRATAALASLDPNAHYEYAFTTKAYSALACGCPVVFAGPGPTRTFLAEAPASLRLGRAVDFDPHAVAAALRDVIEPPLTAAEREQLAAWTHTEHSLASVAVRVADEVTDVVANRGRNAG